MKVLAENSLLSLHFEQKNFTWVKAEHIYKKLKAGFTLDIQLQCLKISDRNLESNVPI